MSVEDLRPIEIDRFGGMCTFLAEEDVPSFMCLEAQNVFFYPGRVETRPGFGSIYSVIDAAGVNAMSIHVYISPDRVKLLIIMANDGSNKYLVEGSGGASADIATALPLDSYSKMANLFGRVFMAFNNGTNPVSYPLRWQYPDIVPPPVSPPGPGSVFTIAEGAPGTGSIGAGLHLAIVWFETDSGYWTRPCPYGSWTATGTNQLVLTNIPIGPSYVTKRLLGFTAAGGTTFYHQGADNAVTTAGFIINDNTTTGAIVDFSESSLVSSTNIDYLFDLITLPPEAAVISYSNRLVWWGERTNMQDWMALGFDGGFLTNVPRGWTAGANQAGGTEHGSYDRGDIGASYRITGNGATAIRGEIRQAADSGSWLTELIQVRTAYTVRAKIKRSSGLVAGSLEIDLVGTGINTTGLVVTAAQASTSYAEFEAELTPAQTAIPIDLQLRLQVTGTPTNAEYFVVDQIEIKPSTSPDNFSILRISKKNDSESYDGVSGYALVSRDDGYAIRALFRIRDFLYIVKEKGVYVTQDNGSDDIGTWVVEEVSATVGTPSVFGVGVGDNWALIVDRAGLYYFGGGQFIKLSQEIQPTWEAFDWTQGHKFWVSVDTQGKRAYIGCVEVGKTKVDRVLMMDFAEGFQDPLENKGIGRKWAVHTIKANAGLVENFKEPLSDLDVTNCTMFAMHTIVSATQPILAVHRFSDSAITDGSDDTTEGNIVCIWRSAYLPGGRSSTRGLHGFLNMDIALREAVASEAIYTLQAHNSGGFIVSLNPLSLSLNPRGDVERMLNIVDDATSYSISTSVGGNFSLKKFTLWVDQALAPVRGRPGR